MQDCSQCGVCCKLFLINLSEEEYRLGRYKTQFEIFGAEQDFEEAERNGLNILEQKEDGSCTYLQDNKCSIHDKRPKVCREFFCDSKEKKYEEMIRMIEKRKG